MGERRRGVRVRGLILRVVKSSRDHFLLSERLPKYVSLQLPPGRFLSGLLLLPQRLLSLLWLDETPLLPLGLWGCCSVTVRREGSGCRGDRNFGRREGGSIRGKQDGVETGNGRVSTEAGERGERVVLVARR